MTQYFDVNMKTKTYTLKAVATIIKNTSTINIDYSM